MAQGRFRKWDIHHLHMYYNWMGHLARMATYDPERVTNRVFQYKDLHYVFDLQSRFGDQTHGRRLHVWRLEWDVYKYFGDRWQQLALDKRAFNVRWDSWLEWRLMVLDGIDFVGH
eukprot:2613929-Karenia_brevis.AAC.1